MLAPTLSRRRLFWLFHIGGWLALVPGFIGLNLLVGVNPATAVLNGVSRQALGFLLTLGLALIYRRWHWEEFSLWRHGLLAGVLSVAAMLVDLLLFEWLSDVLRLRSDFAPPHVVQISGSFGRICIYGSWSAIYLAVSHFLDLRARDLRLACIEIAARDAELQTLRSQLNPHFLFNALNSILAEADDNPERVKAITLSLSELLRFSLRQRDHFGSLGEELAAIENYLQVEHSRFEERVDWRIDATPAARLARVPTHLLLPLVENAIKYGLQTSPAPLHLRIGAGLCDDGAVAASVENSGRWVEPDPTATRSTGIGLPNLRRRLALLCGPQARVNISFPPGFVRVSLQVPPSPARP